MNLQEKIQVIETDAVIAKKSIDRVIVKYPFPISMLVRGNKTGLSVTIDEHFEKVPTSVFIQKKANQN